MLPLKDTVHSYSFSMVNWLLIAANVLCFLIELAAGPSTEAFVTALGVVPRRFLLDPGPGQVMTLFSSMFLQGGWLHLLSKMLALYIFGDNV